MTAYDDVISLASEFARSHGWKISEIPPDNRMLDRMTDEKEWTYDGETRGIEIFPHEKCEPFRLEFDSNRFLQEYTKTQFAPIEIHVELVELLNRLEHFFSDLFVYDEGGYFETSDIEQLTNQRRFVENGIAGWQLDDPQGQSAVRLPSGRIMDFLGR